MILKGIVQKGKKRGRTLGFPTANITVHTNASDGIYLSIAIIDNIQYPSLTFIGIPETFHEQDRTIEVYILSFDEDIYGKELQVELLEKIRENQKFTSEDELVKQMKHDTMVARSYFQTHPIT